jgi:asparagine synthase (glutamine-hydrolysing)
MRQLSFSAKKAHERLAIVGVSTGAQPIRNKEQSLFLSVNGEIYDHENIKKQERL